MNKPYFTKYIEIKDKVRCNHCMWVGDEDIYTCPKCGKDDAMMQPFMQLFLCSRDINWEKDLHDLNTMIHAPFDGEDTNPYKVIGEVSHNAIWVKPDMEFEEDEVYTRPIFIKAQYPHKCVVFKCPTCSTFH